MKEKRIFIFEAEQGMILAKDVFLSDGYLITPANTTLTYDIIQKISNFHILEIIIKTDFSENKDSTYFKRVRQSEKFKRFNIKYQDNVSELKSSLSDMVNHSKPVNTYHLLSQTHSLMDETTGTYNIFDMLHSMREFDDLTFVHSVNVALICNAMGKWMEFNEKDINILTLCGLLHDIGKLLIPSNILKKPSRLTLGEFDVIKTHTTLGHSQLNANLIDERIKEACLYHHEHCDGKGYPEGLTKDSIPVFAKITAIADVYDAMTSNRVYRGAICPFEVIRSMERGAYTQFDPVYLLPFLFNVIATYIGCNVELTNGEIGKVILINQNDISRPTIKCGNEYINLSKNRNLDIVALL